MKRLLACFTFCFVLSSAVSAQIVTPQMDKLASVQGKPLPLPFDMHAPAIIDVLYAHPVHRDLSPLERAAGKTTVETRYAVFELKNLGQAVPDVLKNKVASCEVLTELVPESDKDPSRVFFRTMSLDCLDKLGKLVVGGEIEGFVAANLAGKNADSKNGLPKAELRKGTPALIILSKDAKLSPANLLVGQ